MAQLPFDHTNSGQYTSLGYDMATHNGQQNRPKPTQNNTGKLGSPANKTNKTKKPPANNKENSKEKIKNFDINSNDVDNLIGKRKSHFPNYDYIKSTHSEKLFNLFHQLLIEYDDIFAKYQYHRRDLNVPPIKLGLLTSAWPDTKVLVLKYFRPKVGQYFIIFIEIQNCVYAEKQ